MNWKNIPDGYKFLIYFEHGYSKKLVPETIKCSLTDPDFEKIKTILSYLNPAIDKHFEDYTENVAQYIEKKTTYSEEEIMNIIENIVLIDIQYNEYLAHVSHIEIYRYEDGKVQTMRL